MVTDSAAAEGWIVLAAAAVAHLGGDAEAVAEAARATADTSRVVFTVDTFEYLHRDGRVPGILKALSDTLHMRPILEIKDDDIALADRVRHTEPAHQKVRAMNEEYASTLTRPAVAVAPVGSSALEEGLGVETTGLMIEEPPRREPHRPRRAGHLRRRRGGHARRFHARTVTNPLRCPSSATTETVHGHLPPDSQRSMRSMACP